MATVVVMPKVGISVESCVIAKWHKKVGDTVKVGDLLFSYETDKASVDEESKVDGVLLSIIANEGDDVPVLENVCIIGEAGEDISSLNASEAKSAGVEEKTEVSVVEQSVVKATVTRNESDILKVSPRAKNTAKKMGIELNQVPPTGPYGRIIERDILSYKGDGSGIGGRLTMDDLNSKPIAGVTAAAVATQQDEVTVVPFTNIRKVIAKQMVYSLSSMAQLTNNGSFDCTSLLSFRKSLKDAGIEGITINDIILYAVSRTIKNHKDLNANLIENEMHYYNSVHLGIAVDTPRGLLVPTLFNVDKMSLSELSKNAKELIAQAKDGTISPDLLKGATFTITNLGSLGVESFTPVINPPQTGILGVCGMVDKVKSVNGELKIYKSMGLSLTYDHRAVDGAPAAKFVQELKSNLENIPTLLIK